MSSLLVRRSKSLTKLSQYLTKQQNHSISVLKPSQSIPKNPTIIKNLNSDFQRLCRNPIYRFCSPRFMSSSASEQAKTSEEPLPSSENNGEPKPSSENSTKTSSQVEEDRENRHEATVERDTSALAEELRAEQKRMMQAMYHLSKAFALLGLTQMACSAWIIYTVKPATLSEISVQGLFALVLPMVLAFNLRSTLKPMTFFSLLEKQSRLQLHTLSIQITRYLVGFLQRANTLAIVCAAGIALGMLFNAGNSVWNSQNAKIHDTTAEVQSG